MLLATARSFAARVKVNFDTPVRAQPEDQLKAPVVELIEGSGTSSRATSRRERRRRSRASVHAQTSAWRSTDS
jgi:hypothetical protein